MVTKRKLLLWGAIIILWGVGVIRSGFSDMLIETLDVLAMYYMAWGVILFLFGWLPRYRRVKRFEKSHPGLMYLVLLREQFGKTK